MIPSSLYCQVCGAANATDRSVCFACSRPLRIDASENTALLQGRYRILTQVGKGGFGAVYRAEDTQQYDGIVAVKQINLRGLTPQETIEATDAFNREVSLLSNLSHPNLPHIYDNFTDPEHWYLVMDFIEGETLESYLEAKGANYTASLDEILTLGVQLCTVLDYLHTREPVIIFRDLKPANIMRTSANKLYLIDFGIARSFKPGKLKDTIPFGSPGYAAPEQYGKAQTTPRADIYSLGALLHMLLTGDDPVDNPFHFAPLRVYGVAGLTDLEALILRMVQIDANRRPTTIVEVKDELQRIADLQASPRLWHPPVGQTPPAFPNVSGGSGQLQISTSSTGQQQQLYVPSSQRKQSSRRKFLVGGFAITGLTIIGVSGVANIVSALQSQPKPDIFDAPLPQHLTSTVFGQYHTYSGQSQPVQDIVWSQDDTLLASASDDGTVQVWTADGVLAGDAIPPKAMYKTIEPATCLAWGQGSSKNKLAFNSGKTITIWDTPTLAISNVEAALTFNGIDVSSDIHTFAWSPDGRYIAFPTSIGVQMWDSMHRGVVSHIEFSTGQTRTREATTSLSWSSDSKYLAVGVAADNETVILDVSKKQVHIRMKDVGGQSVVWSPDGSCLATVNKDTVNVSYFAGNAFSAHYQLQNTVTAVAWSHDSKYLVAASQDISQNIHVWSPFTHIADTVPSQFGTPILNDGSTFTTYIETHKADIYSLAWSSNSKYIAIGADSALLLEIDTSVLYS